MNQVDVLALSGSLRAGSHNTALLHAARTLHSGGLAIDIDHDLGRLPLYNQDLDTGAPPAPVAELRARSARYAPSSPSARSWPRWERKCWSSRR
ncbi:NADPH-dependent FMN reductase [Nonomuraea angiospora]